MIVLLKIVLLVALLLVLIRLKLDLGLALFVTTSLTALFFRMEWNAFRVSVVEGAASGETLELAGIIVLVLFIGEFLQKSGSFRIMVDALKNLVHGDRLIILSPAHLCLALTADYFKAEMKDVYRILGWTVAAVFAAALLELLVFRVF